MLKGQSRHIGEYFGDSSGTLFGWEIEIIQESVQLTASPQIVGKVNSISSIEQGSIHVKQSECFGGSRRR